MDDTSFNRLVDRIYDSVAAPEEHDHVLHEVLRTTNSHFMVVSGFRPGDQVPIVPRFIGELSSRRLDGIADYHAGAAAGDLTVAFVNANPNGGSFATDRNMHRSAHATHPYIKWNKHFVGNAHWIANFEAKDGALFGVSLHSCLPEDPHDPGERRKFELLFRHMARAWRLSTRPADLNSRNEALTITSCAGRVLIMSPAAEALVEAGDGLVLHLGEMLPCERRLWSRWRDAVRQVAIGPSQDDQAMMLPRPGRAKPLLAIIGAAPLRPGFGSYSRDVFIRIIDRDAQPVNVTATLMKLWGLTPAEARLVQTLVQNGFALREAADRLGVTYATVRTQLASVFAKTDTGGQPELMRLLTLLSS
jgi:DNA-binding CsgD family transcriptional regulator